jgi:hypothetical protein
MSAIGGTTLMVNLCGLSQVHAQCKRNNAEIVWKCEIKCCKKILTTVALAIWANRNTEVTVRGKNWFVVKAPARNVRVHGNAAERYLDGMKLGKKPSNLPCNKG